MPCRPPPSVSRTRPPPVARAIARAPATVDLPVPPLPVTTCRRTSLKGCALGRSTSGTLPAAGDRRTVGRSTPPGGRRADLLGWVHAEVGVRHRPAAFSRDEAD